MKRADSLPERVRTIFGARNDAGQRVALVLVEGPGNVVVEETSASGFAHVECRVPAGFQILQYHHRTTDFRPLATDKNADGNLLVVRPDGALEAHVMECKETVTASEWDKALRQFEWSLIRLLAIAGALHERVERVVLYTAYANEALSTNESADSALFEAPISDDLDPVALRHRAWNLPRVPLRGWVTAFEHVRVEKEKGRASLDLRVGRPLSEL